MDRCDDSHLLTLLPFQRNGLTWGVHGMGCAQLCNLCSAQRLHVLHNHLARCPRKFLKAQHIRHDLSLCHNAILSVFRSLSVTPGNSEIPFTAAQFPNQSLAHHNTKQLAVSKSPEPGPTLRLHKITKHLLTPFS